MFLQRLVFAVLLIVVLLVVRVLAYSQCDDSVWAEQKMSYLLSLRDLEAAACRPDIVLIVFDDLGYGHLGVPSVYGIASGFVGYAV